LVFLLFTTLPPFVERGVKVPSPFFKGRVRVGFLPFPTSPLAWG
jgi:hypothetical protein